MKKRCLIVTPNMVEAFDLGELVAQEYGMKVETHRNASAASSEVGATKDISLAFVSAEHEGHAMSDLVQGLLRDGANVIVINGSSARTEGHMGFLRRPYSAEDISRIISDFQ